MNKYVETQYPIPPGAKLYATTRVFTGIPTARAYVYDRVSGKCVWACGHEHRGRVDRRGGRQADGQYQRTNGEAFAARCAERALKRLLRDQ